jgi:hypothetical protein
MIAGMPETPQWELFSDIPPEDTKQPVDGMQP